MQFKSIAALLAAVSPVLAAQPLCDKYTTALLMDNSAKNQYTLLTLLVNTVVIGNYTQPNMNAVPGILAPGEYMGEKVNLLPYFDGSLKSTNTGGSSGVSVNFLDGGGAAPLEKNMPGAKGSAQYTLLTHLYEFFGILLGCSKIGTSAFPNYGGNPSMYQVHKYMALNSAQTGYFIQQVGLAATSFGVSKADVTTVANALTSAFDVRCAPAVSLAKGVPKELESICITSDCPLAPNSDCSAYAPVVQPMPAGNSTSPASASGTGAASVPATSAPSSAASSMAAASSSAAATSAPAAPSPAPNAGAVFGPSVAAVAGLAALAFAL